LGGFDLGGFDLGSFVDTVNQWAVIEGRGMRLGFEYASIFLCNLLAC